MMRAIPSLPGYLASDDGHIYSVRGRWGPTLPRRLTEVPTHDGYLRVRVARERGATVKDTAVAVLVAETFHGPRPPGLQVRHLNGNNQDNQASNLRYGTAKENAADRDAHGHTRRGIANNKARHTDDDVIAAVRLVATGTTSQAQVARRYGVSDSTIARWRRGEARAHPIAVWRGVS